MPKARNSSKLILTNENILQNSKSIMLGNCSACYASPLSTVTKSSVLKSIGQRQSVRKNANNMFSLPAAVPSQFKTKLVLAFMPADIPLFKLRNLQIVSLFATWGQTVPSETVCQDFIHQLAEAETSRIQQIIQGKKVFFIVDENEFGNKKLLDILVGNI